MKYSKLIISILVSLLFSIIAGVGISMATGWSPLAVAGAIFAISLIPKPQIPGLAYAGVMKEVWTKEVIKRMTTLGEGTFLDGIKDFSQYVSSVGDESQVIHMTYFGVKPDVLINNTTYEIEVQELNGEDVNITLDKFQTKATPITDDELYALSYDKIGLVKDSHAEAIMETKIKKALHALAPGSNTAAMPVLTTTGADDGTGRKRLQWSDLVALKKACDNLMIPATGRRLVLCSDHENDMLLLDTKFKDQYYNAASGKPYSTLGFEFYGYIGAPYYVPATKTKVAFGAVPGATDRQASVFFSLVRSGKASGWTKMYFSKSENDPLRQRNLVNFRHHYIVLPLREEARGAIVSANV